LVLAREYSGSATMRRPEQAFLVAFVAAACFSRRFATQLVAIDIGVLGAMLDGGSPSEPARTTGALARAALAEAMLAGLLGIYWLSERKDPLRDVPARAAELARPLERVQRATEPARARVVNPLHWGGYLAYAWMGDPRYFIDGRDQVFLFGNGAFEDQAALWNGAPNALALLDVYEAGTVIWERGAPLDSILRHAVGWNLVHEDRIAVLYERRP
jgi:hypothetical protein